MCVCVCVCVCERTIFPDILAYCTNDCNKERDIGFNDDIIGSYDDIIGGRGLPLPEANGTQGRRVCGQMSERGSLDRRNVHMLRSQVCLTACVHASTFTCV